MNRLYDIFAESFLDGFNGAGLFGWLGRPYAPSEMIDSFTVEDFQARGVSLKLIPAKSRHLNIPDKSDMDVSDHPRITRS